MTPAVPSRTGDARPAHGKVLTKGMTTAGTSRSPPAEPAVTKNNATPRLPRAARASQPKQLDDLPEHFLTRNRKLATALPRRRSPLGSTSAGQAVDPALAGAHHSRRTPTTILMLPPRAPTGEPDRDPSGDGAPPKQRVSVKSSAEYVAKIVDAAPPLTDNPTQSTRGALKANRCGVTSPKRTPAAVHDPSSLAPGSACRRSYGAAWHAIGSHR